MQPTVLENIRKRLRQGGRGVEIRACKMVGNGVETDRPTR